MGFITSKDLIELFDYLFLGEDSPGRTDEPVLQFLCLEVLLVRIDDAWTTSDVMKVATYLRQILASTPDEPEELLDITALRGQLLDLLQGTELRHSLQALPEKNVEASNNVIRHSGQRLSRSDALDASFAAERDA